MSQDLPFEPFPFIDDPHHQTIIGSLFNLLHEPGSEQKLISLEDGDWISLEVTTPSQWKPTDLTILLVHGLCGSHKSPYLVRLVRKLEPLGIRTIRFNMRNCGSGRGLSKKIYHSGRSEDLFECLKVLKKEHPNSPMLLIGFSLGGNIVLKLVGELGNLAPLFLDQVIAVSPPVELYSSILLLGEPSNSIYEKYFYRLLRAEVYYIHKKFHLGSIHLPKDLKLYEFDQLYTAPYCGFTSAFDYYDKCSSVHLIPEIAIPCKILLSEDDPIVSHRPLDALHLPSHVEVYKTKKGGHMGYLGTSGGKGGLYWLDQLLFDWIFPS